MADYKVDVRIDLDKFQKDWDDAVRISDAYGKKVKAVVKSLDEVSGQTAQTKKTAQAIRNLSARTEELIQRMQKISKARKIEGIDVARAQREAKGLSNELRKLSTHSSRYTNKLDKLTAATKSFGTVTKRAEEATAGWWKRFGAVAVGFGVAYRAINVLENGLASYVEILREGLVAQDEFIELQAKLAMYSQLYGSNAATFAEGFKMATVNIAAFRKELPMAISSVGDLTQGIDEFVQHGLAIGPMTAHGMVNFLDFTSMIATTVGATSKQIRQEIQSLFEGTQRAGNTLLRLMKSLIPEFDELLERIRGPETAAAMDKMFAMISIHMDELKKVLAMMSMSKAHTIWRKQLVLDIQASANLAASMKGLADGTNVFAEVFYRHSKGLSLAIQDELAVAFVALSDALDELLEKSPEVLTGLVKLTKWLAQLASLAVDYGMLILYAGVLKGLSVAIGSLGKSLVGFGFAKVGAGLALLGGIPTKLIMLFAAATYGLNELSSTLQVSETATTSYADALAYLKKKLESLDEETRTPIGLAIIDLELAGKKAGHVLHRLATELDRDSAAGKAFKQAMDEIGLSVKEVTVIGRAYNAIFDKTIKTQTKAAKENADALREALEIHKKIRDLTEEASEITLTFYTKLQAAAKAGITKDMPRLIAHATLEFEEKLKALNIEIAKFAEGMALDPENITIRLVFEQLSMQAKELKDDLNDLNNLVPLYVGLTNKFSIAFQESLTTLKAKSAQTGKDVSVDILALCQEFYDNLEHLTVSAGIAIDSPELQAALKKAYSKANATTVRVTKQINELWTEALNRIQSQIADTFYDAFRGELNSASDYFKAFCDIILRYWAETMAKMAMYDLFGVGTGPGLSELANMFGGVGKGTAQPGGASGIQQGIQGVSSAYSLSQAYGAYGAAGGGWSGLGAGASSFFGYGGSAGGTAAPAATWSLVGGIPTATPYAASATATAGSTIGSAISTIPWTWWAAAIVIAADYFAKLNVKKGYGLVEGTPEGFRDPYQPTNAFGLDFGTDPFGTWLRGTIGLDEPMAGNYLDAAIARSDWGTALRALPATILEWSSPFITMGLNALGLDFGRIFGFSNKKRSYYGETYGFQDYSPDEGWGISDFSHTWKDKRKGKKAFGEAGAGMAETAQGLMSALDFMFKNLLGVFDKAQVNAFTTAMAMLSAEMVPVTEATRGYQRLLAQGITEVPRMSYQFYIGAEDKGEFKKDWKKSWARMIEGVIDPIVEIGSVLLGQALDDAVTDATAWNYFTDEMREYLKTGLEDSLEDLKIDWSVITDQKSFEAALEEMGLAVDQIANIVNYFTEVGKILEHITTAIDFHSMSDAARNAIEVFSGINAEFAQYAAQLESLGIDLERYTDLEVAHQLALQDSIKAMSSAGIVGEDLSIALRHVADEMLENGRTAEEVEALYRSASLGIQASIQDIMTAHENYGDTLVSTLSEKYDIDLSQFGYADWKRFIDSLGDGFSNLSIDLQQDLRNLGVVYEQQYEALVDAVVGIESTTQAMLDNGTASEDLADYLDNLEQSMTQAGFTVEQVAAVINASVKTVINSIADIYAELEHDGPLSLAESIAGHYEGITAADIESIRRAEWMQTIEDMGAAWVEAGSPDDYGTWADTTYGAQVITDWESWGRQLTEGIAEAVTSPLATGGGSIWDKIVRLTELNITELNTLFAQGAEWIVSNWRSEMSKMMMGEQVTAVGLGDMWTSGFVKDSSENLFARYQIESEALATAFDQLTYEQDTWVEFYRVLIEEIQAGNITVLVAQKFWPTMTTALYDTILAADDATDAIEDMTKALADAAVVMDEINTILSHAGLSASAKGALTELSGINDKFQKFVDILTIVDQTDFTELQNAYNVIIQDWIQKVFAGAIAFADTSQGWAAMAAGATKNTAQQYLDQYQIVSRLTNAYDGTISSAIDLSDAFDLLGTLSFTLASKIQNAISSIRESYESLIESIRLEVMAPQGQYDFYRDAVAGLYDTLATLTDSVAIQQATADIQKYTQAAWGLLSEEQRVTYAGQYIDFLQQAETTTIARLEESGKLLDEQNENFLDRLEPILKEVAEKIMQAAVVQQSAAEGQVVAANTQLDAAGMPITVNVVLSGGSGEVG